MADLQAGNGSYDWKADPRFSHFVDRESPAANYDAQIWAPKADGQRNVCIFQGHHDNVPSLGEQIERAQKAGDSESFMAGLRREILERDRRAQSELAQPLFVDDPGSDVRGLTAEEIAEQQAIEADLERLGSPMGGQCDFDKPDDRSIDGTREYELEDIDHDADPDALERMFNDD